jgi:hypothetical protein
MFKISARRRIMTCECMCNKLVLLLRSLMDGMIRARIGKKNPMLPSLNFGVLQLLSVFFFCFLTHLIDYEVAWNRLKQSGETLIMYVLCLDVGSLSCMLYCY